LEQGEGKKEEDEKRRRENSYLKSDWARGAANGEESVIPGSQYREETKREPA